MAYLIHYNKNHSAKNGQFISGDGDGDGIVNDHAHKNRESIKPVGEKDGKYTMTSYTVKNKAGINLRYVSPNNLMRSGYWIDADTGKKASFGNQWKVPHEFVSKERGKSYFQLGVGSTASALVGVGATFIKEYVLS